MAKVAAVILAAGESARFGKPKQFLRFRGKTLLRRIVDAASEADCAPVIVVAGSGSDGVREELQATNAAVVENKNWERGIGTSIRAGVQHLIDNANEVDAAMLLVCDQPFVDATVIKQLISLREKTAKQIVASSYAETLGVPALFDRSCFKELLALNDSAGAKSIVLSNPERLAKLYFPGAKIDIDTVADFEKLPHGLPPKNFLND